MNIVKVIKHIYPQAVNQVDFTVRDDGPVPVLRPGIDGLFRFQLRPLAEGETEEIEGIHYRMAVDYNRLTLGEDYDIVECGPYIAAWNMPDPQPTEAEMQAAWEAIKDLPAEPSQQTPEERIAALEADKAALKAEMEAKDRENKLALFEIYNMLMGGE
ncbi:XkdW protein [compost metagenome]